MADKEKIDIDDDELGLDFNLDDDEFNFDTDFTDGSENKKDRTPLEAIKAGVKDSLKSSLDSDRLEGLSDKIMPDKFTSAKDDLKNYIYESKQLFDESYGEVSKGISDARQRARKAAMAYEKAGMPKILVDLLKKVGGRDEEREAELDRQRTEAAENQAEITEALDDMSRAQIEMQKAAQAREMIREEMDGKRFESQQELLFGIRTTLQRSTDYNEQIATRYYNNQIKISFQQLHTQRAIYKSVLQSAEHQKAALDSIVKNTALPDIVKQHKSELMKDIVSRRLGNYVSSKFGDYVSTFKDQFMGNVKDTVKGAISGFTGMVDMTSSGLETHADMTSMMSEFDEMSGGRAAHKNGEDVAKWLTTFITNRMAKHGLSKMDRGGKVSAFAEKLHRTMNSLPGLANRIKEESNRDDAGIIARLLGGLIPGYAEGNVKHDVNSEAKLKELAEFDNKTRSSIVDVIPALLSKIHQSTEAIRKSVASEIKLNDDNLLEWDVGEQKLTTRKRLDVKLAKRIRSASDMKGQQEKAYGIINTLIDPKGPSGKQVLTPDIKDILAENIIQYSTTGKGFVLKDWLDVDSKVYKDIDRKDVFKIIDLVRANLSVEAINKYSEYEIEQRKTAFHHVMNDIAAMRGRGHDTVGRISSISGTDQQRAARIGFGINSATGEFITDNKGINNAEQRRLRGKRLKQEVKDNYQIYYGSHYGSVDDSIQAFRNVKGYIYDENGGTVPNTSKFFMRDPISGRVKERLNYDEWKDFLRTDEGKFQDASKDVKQLVGTFAGKASEKLQDVGNFVLGEERMGKLNAAGNKVGGVFGSVAKHAGNVATILGAGKVINAAKKVGKGVDNVIDNVVKGFEDVATDMKWNMPKNASGGYDWEEIEKRTKRGTNNQVYWIIFNEYLKLKESGLPETSIDSLIELFIKEKTGREDSNIALDSDKARELREEFKADNLTFDNIVSVTNNLKSSIVNAGKTAYSIATDKDKRNEYANTLKTQIDYGYNAFMDDPKGIAKSGITKAVDLAKDTTVGKTLVGYKDNVISGFNEQYGEQVSNAKLKLTGIGEEILQQYSDIKSSEDKLEKITEIMKLKSVLPDEVVKYFSDEQVKATAEYLKEKAVEKAIEKREQAKTAIREFNEDPKGTFNKHAAKMQKKLSEKDYTNIQTAIKDKLGIDVPIVELAKNTKEEVTSMYKALNTNDITESPALLEIANNFIEKTNDALSETKVGKFIANTKDMVEKRERDAEQERKANQVKTADVYVRGETEPRLLGIHLATGRYIHKHGDKAVYSIDEIEGPLVDRETGLVVLSTDDFNKGLVTTAGEEVNVDTTRQQSNLSKFTKMDSWTMTKAVVKALVKPIPKTMDTTDVYLPNEDGGPPTLVIRRVTMMFNGYQDENGKVIKRIQDITGNVYDRMGNLVLSAEDLKRAVDVKGRPLSKSYFIRRARLAKDMLSPLVKLHTAPLKWMAKKLISEPVKNRTSGVYEGLKDRLGAGSDRLANLLPFMKKRKGNSEDELESQDANTKAREEAAAKRREEELKRREGKKDNGFFTPLIEFLKGSFKKLLLFGGPLYMLFKDGISAGMGKIWDMGKWVVDNLGGTIWEAIKWLGGPLLALMGAKAGVKYAGGKLIDMAADALSGTDIDVDRRGDKKPRKGRKGLFKGAANKLINTFKPTPKTTAISKGANIQQKYTVAQQAAKSTATKAAQNSMSKAGQHVVAKQAAKKAATEFGKQTAVKTASTLASKTALKAGTSLALRGGLLAAGSLAAGPLIGIALGVWTLYEVGSWVWKWSKSPNSVDKFRIAAYGVDPENEYRADTILKLEEYITSISKIDESGNLTIPDIKWDEKGKPSEIMMAFLGGDNGRDVFGSMLDEERMAYGNGFENWYVNRFIPVYRQHAISLYQIDKKLKLNKAFDRVGSGTIKFGLVNSWLNRSYLGEGTDTPYQIMDDPFLYVEEDSSKPVTGPEDVKRYYDDVFNRYKDDEVSLRKEESRLDKQANAMGKSRQGLFNFESTTEKYDSSKDKSLGIGGNPTPTAEAAVKRIAYNKDGSLSTTEVIGNNIYVLSDIEKIDTNGRTVIDDGIAIRMRLYGLTDLIDTKVNAILTLEKMTLKYLKLEGTGFASFSKFNFDEIFSAVGITLGWTGSVSDKALFKAWFTDRFSSVFLGYASLVNQYSKSTDILNAINKLKAEDKYQLYLSLSQIKGKYNGVELPIWDLPYGPLKDIPFNKDSSSISVNLTNLEHDLKLNLLTERDPSKQTLPKAGITDDTDTSVGTNNATVTEYKTGNEKVDQSIGTAMSSIGKAVGGLNQSTVISKADALVMGGDPGVLAEVIASHESKGNYNIYNKGSKHGYKRGSMDFSKMTVAQVMELQNLPTNHKDKLFAVGKYQIIPDVLREIVKVGILKPSDNFGPESQDKALTYLLGKKRPAIMKFITGGHDDINKAIDHAAYEWASMQNSRGKAQYGGINAKAPTTVNATKDALLRARKSYQELIKQGMSHDEAFLKAVTGKDGGAYKSVTTEGTSGNTIANMATSVAKTVSDIKVDSDKSVEDIYAKANVGYNATTNEIAYTGSGGTFGQHGERKDHKSTPGMVRAIHDTKGIGKSDVLGGGDISDRAKAAAKHITSGALPKSAGYCAKYTANALTKAGYKFTRQPSAFMYTTKGTMESMGFTPIAKGYDVNPLPGDVMVLPAHGGKGGGGIHGHIQMWNGSNWVSDFVQRSIMPNQQYAKVVPTLYRDLSKGVSSDGKASGEMKDNEQVKVDGSAKSSPLEQSANNGSYNQQTVNSDTGYTDTSGGIDTVLGGGSFRPSVDTASILPQVSQNTYSGVHAHGGVTTGNSLKDAWGKALRPSGNIANTEKAEQAGLQTYFDKQGSQLEAQQKVLVEQSKQMSDAMVNVLKEQLTVQKDSKELLGKLVEFFTEGKKIAGTNVTDPKQSRDNQWYEIPKLAPGQSRHSIGKQVNPAVNMGIGR